MSRTETSTAYNADEMIKLHLELLGAVERERLEKSSSWVRSTVNDLIQRIYNLRKMLNERDEEMRGLTSTQNEYGGRLRVDGGKGE